VKPGERFAERFVLEALAGTGGMGAVYRARDLTNDATVALKILLRPSDGPRFEREARILAELRSPAVVRYVAHGTDALGRQWLAMEWLEGEDLEQRLARGPLPWQVAVTLGRRLAEGLGAAHAKGIVHRDVKPTNVMLLEGDPARPVLLDFGIARLEEAKHNTLTGQVLGTPGYLAPEQARGEPSVDGRADVFALGSLLFECVTGRPTFGTGAVMGVLTRILFEPSPRVRELVPGAPERLDHLVSRMLEKIPSHRPRDARAVAEELAAIEVGESSDTWDDISIGHTSRALVTVIVAQAPAVRDGRDAVLATLTERFGVKFQQLIDGSIAARITGAKVATDQAVSAVRCAIALHEALRPRVVAVATGSAVDAGSQTAGSAVGEIIGRAVDLAVSGGRGVRLDRVTADLVQERFELSRGSEDAEVIGVGAPARPSSSRCIGRERELEAITAVIAESARTPSARAVLVLGEAGIGKSTLVRGAVERAASLASPRPTTWWVAATDPDREGAPFGLIAGMLRAGGLAGPGRAHPHPEHDEIVSEVLGVRRGEPSARLVAARASPVLFADRVVQALVEHVGALCATAPLGIVLEDLHAADAPSLDAIDALLRRLDAAPLVLVATARDELLERAPAFLRERRTTSLRLGPLSRADGLALARARLGPDAPAGTVEAVVGRADGHPFFLEELARSARSGSRELPGSVQAMLQARFEALSAPARRALRAASVLGERIDLAAINAIATGTGQGELVALGAEEILVEDDGGWRFRSPMLREVAYATLTDEDRALGHRLAAQWLARKGRASAVVLAEHWLRAGDAAEAATACARAAEEALAANDLERALAYAERGLALRPKGDPRGALLLTLAEACVWKGHLAEAKEAAERACKALPRGARSWCAAASVLSAASGRLGDRATLAAIAAELESIPPDAENARELGMGLARAATHLFFDGEIERGRRATAALAEVEAASGGDVGIAARLAQTRAVEARYSGDPVGHLQHTQAALAAREELHDARTACVLRANLGDGWKELGQYAEAERCLREALAVAAEHGIRAVTSPATITLGVVLLRTGRLDEARALFEDAVAETGRAGDRRLEAAGRIYLAEALLAGGSIDDARNEIDAAGTLLDERSPYMPLAFAVESVCRRQGGDLEGALRCAEQAVSTLADLGGHAEDGELASLLALAEAREATGEHAGASRALAVARQRLDATLAKIADPALRAAFEENVPEARRIDALARAWARST
jgi:tetratricopeptide (TPR) repeat protein